MARTQDDFERHAAKILGDTKLFRELMALRSKAFADDVSDTATADEINANNQVWFDKAANLLGEEKFQTVFGYHPFERINLVDPDVMRRSNSAGARTDDKKPHSAVRTTSSVTLNHPPVVTLKYFSWVVASHHGISKKKTEVLFGDFVARITKHLKRGERVRIAGLGVLEVRKRSARLGRNPATGKVMRIKSGKKIAFRASKELQEVVSK